VRPLARGSRPLDQEQELFENKSYYNFGCAYQRNMAAMVDNPADLVQPRPETPAYTTGAAPRSRSIARVPDHDQLSESDKAKLSDTGK